MITGVAAMLVGEAVGLGLLRLGVWAALFVAVNHVYFVLSEEPGLVKRFGAEYERYRREVPRWLPRGSAWHSSGAGARP
jgi:protein-S-isoprenylcysteine O-methyltransferase Ste14